MGSKVPSAEQLKKQKTAPAEEVEEGVPAPKKRRGRPPKASAPAAAAGSAEAMATDPVDNGKIYGKYIVQISLCDVYIYIY